MKPFESYITKLASGCWCWTGTLNSHGYGMWKQRGAYRTAYKLWVGPIPTGFCIHHTCRHKWCVCPSHLEATTFKKNIEHHVHWLGQQRVLNQVPVPSSSSGKKVIIKNILTDEMKEKLRVRILSKTDMRLGYDSCWPWKGMIDKDGYGRFVLPKQYIGVRQPYAHRVVYELLIGSIPAGLVLDHLCHNAKCVNPKHLEPVSQAENTRRSHMAKLTREDVIAIRSSSEPHTVTALQYGLHPSTVCDIRLGNRWA